MKRLIVTILALFVGLGSYSVAQQNPNNDPTPVNPARVILWRNACRGEASTATFSIYRQEADTIPIWQETQALTGSYYSYVGNTTGGLPIDVFSNGDAGWMSLVCDGDPATLAPMALTAVPYAISAIDSANLGGRPASDYALASQVNRNAAKGAVSGDARRARQAEADLSQAIASEASSRQDAISAIQLNEVATSSQIASLNAAIVSLQLQIAALQLSHTAPSAQVPTLLAPNTLAPAAHVSAPTALTTSDTIPAPANIDTMTSFTGSSRLVPNIQR
jgi:hypothetical protein